MNVCSHLSIMNLTLSSAFSLQKSLKEIEMLMFLFKFTNSFNRSRSAVRPGSPLLACWQACFLGLLSGAWLSRAFPACMRVTWSPSLGVTLFPFFPLAPACGVSPLTRPGFPCNCVLYLVFFCRNYMRPKVTLFPSERSSFCFCQKSGPTRCPEAGLQNSSVTLKILFIISNPSVKFSDYFS